MCGIAGEIRLKGLAPRPEHFYGQILRSMERRGPDQAGLFADSRCTLLHRRLCVIDPEHGQQPMTIGPCTIAYNGELYNAGDLRTELESLGEHFTTHSDTEVLLRAYLRWGAGTPERLNGIFSFAVWDARNQSLFIARDPMGVKPLFYALRGDTMFFASELKTLLLFPEIQPEVDARGLYDLMFLGPGRTPGCGVFRNVFEVLPGYMGTFDERGLTMTPYWTLRDGPCEDSFEACVEHTRFLVEDAIRRQLVSDVPLGTFLSGGLDSSIISAVAARERGGVDTFSVDYRDNDRYFRSTKFQPNSDAHFIGIMEEAIHAGGHHIILDTDALVSGLMEAAEARDLPGMADVDSSMLLLSRAVREYVTVILSGECADEIFGGYPWYRDPEIRAINGFPWAQTTRYRASFARQELLDWEDPDEFVRRRYEETLSSADLTPGLTPLEKRMKEMMVLNLRWFMQTLLDRKDRMSMWSGLEIRVPFCDKRIVEYLYRVPWSYKDYKGREKGLLRYAFRDLLPAEITARKKSPYPKTWNPDYMAAVSDLLRQELQGTNSPLLAFLKKDALLDLCSEDRSQPWYGQLMTTPQTIAYFLQMAHWMRVRNVSVIL
ncbi:MAG: asparagine synthase (glutamine-hydrolyzing) [Oscillospiraceae bacterium]|nr:asparagine synthase (glutamine-hydrolyzing) [Oscillospiraceae bacterium]